MTEQRDVVVIGGGQAGLAVGYHLARQKCRFTILEAAGEPAAAWRSRWDSLRLFTSVRYDSLPGLDFPGDPSAYPSRDDVIAYLLAHGRRDMPALLSTLAALDRHSLAAKRPITVPLLRDWLQRDIGLDR